MKLFICVLLTSAAVLATVSAQEAKDDEYTDYEEFYGSDQLKEEGEKIEAELDKLEAANNLKVKDDISKYVDAQDYDEDAIEVADDYQFEDNRDKKEERKDVPSDNDGSFEADEDRIEEENKKEGKDYALLSGDDSVAPLPVPAADPDDYENEPKSEEEILDETRKILESIDDSFDEKTNEQMINEAKKDFETVNALINGTIKNELEDIAGIIDTNQNSKEDTDKSGSQDKLDNEKESDIIKLDEEEEDTVDKVVKDLNADLDKLLDTMNKLSDSSEKDVKNKDVDNIDEHFLKDDDTNVDGLEEIVDKDNEYEDVDFDKIIKDIIGEDDMKDPAADDSLKIMLNDAINEPNPDDAFEKEVEALPNVNAEPNLFQDAFLDEGKEAESIEKVNDKESKIDASIEDIQDKHTEEKESEIEKVNIDSLNSEQLQDLVDQFAKAHSDVLDVHSEAFDRNVAPVHIKINPVKPEVITSPNYPNNYPTNNVIDWVIEGDGMGIELNITDFLVRGALDDYLLVIPGGIDDSSDDGLLFTFRLNSEKRFRFMDVDRLFVRFSTGAGWLGARGFRMSVKLISPLPDAPEPIPDPEPVVEPPHFLHTLHLAAAASQVQQLREQLRQLIVNMADEYIREYDIYPGHTSTEEVTQITSIAACPVTWPGHQFCTAVTIGVPLNYTGMEEDLEPMMDEGHLRDMWDEYSEREPWATQLKEMAIANFDPPKRSILTAWLVIGAGVVISVMMLAFVLWRFSCFEDYTRMKVYSDTDSLQDAKRGLDLYPTPHQTLPPLYAESEYKWHESDDTRVDVGGFANRSYARDMYDFDSDDDDAAQRNRSGAVTARDIYNGSNA